MKIFERHIHITSMDAKQLHDALYAVAPDFEDMLQYYSAASSECNYIVTRNEKHFPQGIIAVMSPTAFLQSQFV
ncbi:MAG: hypothetical protein IJU81_08905 [Bacteroidales bacterium]|nr:hypothetical protein [Bacteroidales bacterium]